MEIILLIGLIIVIWWLGGRILVKLDDGIVEIQQMTSETRDLRKELAKQAATMKAAPAPSVQIAPSRPVAPPPVTVPPVVPAPPVAPAPPPVVPQPVPVAAQPVEPVPVTAPPPPPPPVVPLPPAAPRPAPVPFQKEQPLKEPDVPTLSELKKPAIATEPAPMAAFTAASASSPPSAAPPVSPRKAEEPPVVLPPEPAEPSFFERNPDWEKFIGENLINKIGIAILVLGIGFFVKYAIDQDWINEVGRVAIGILAGGALLGVAHRLHTNFKGFSSVLVGGGMAVLYFTIAIAFHEYQLFGQTAAFLLMVGITGFTIFLAVAYDRIELGVVALIGGFGSPFMVSTGEGNYVVLFTFILILNLGILVLAYFKKWNLLNIIAYIFTVVLYSGWLSTRVINATDPPYTGALFFATVFYLVFFMMNIINNIKEKRRFIAFEFMILLSNTFLYYTAGMYVLQTIGGGAYKGLFTAAIAGFNLLFAYLLYKSRKADRNLVYLLIGLVLTFLSLVAPVQLEGNHITLFWALEAVLLLWLSQQSGISLIRVASAVVLALMMISLVMDWQLYLPLQPEQLAVVLNKAFVTGIVAVLALAAIWFLLQREREDEYEGYLQPQSYRMVAGAGCCLLLYLVLQLELYYQLNRFGVSYSAKVFTISFYHFLFVAGILLYHLRMPDPQSRKGPAVLGAVAILCYLVLLQPAAVITRDRYLTGGGGGYTFMLHYLSMGLALFFLWFVLRTVREQVSFESQRGKAALWLVSAVAVFLASAEVEHLALLVAHKPGLPIDPLLSQVRKIGFAIIWGLSSFVLMYLGMAHKLKTLRVISLSLFALTLLKLFLVDIRGISEGGKIAAFICLGIILLVVSFMYQKLKGLILEDDKDIPSDEAPAKEKPL